MTGIPPHGRGTPRDGLLILESVAQRLGGIDRHIIANAKMQIALGTDMDRWVKDHDDPELAWCAVWCAASGVPEIIAEPTT